MTVYRARMMDAASGAEGQYDFEGAEDLLNRSPVRVVKAFMDHVDRDLLSHEHVDYELNAAFKNRERQVVTALGSLILPHDGPLPFLLMIAPAEG